MFFKKITKLTPGEAIYYQTNHLIYILLDIHMKISSVGYLNEKNFPLFLQEAFYGKKAASKKK